MPQGSNFIVSHSVYKIKVDPGPVYVLKSRLCVHGNHDDEKSSARSDAAVISHLGFRTTYAIAAKHEMLLIKADIRGAYTHSGSSKRIIYVRPPFEHAAAREMWLL